MFHRVSYAAHIDARHLFLYMRVFQGKSPCLAGLFLSLTLAKVISRQLASSWCCTALATVLACHLSTPCFDASCRRAWGQQSSIEMFLIVLGSRCQ